MIMFERGTSGRKLLDARTYYLTTGVKFTLRSTGGRFEIKVLDDKVRSLFTLSARKKTEQLYQIRKHEFFTMIHQSYLRQTKKRSFNIAYILGMTSSMMLLSD